MYKKPYPELYLCSYLCENFSTVHTASQKLNTVKVLMDPGSDADVRKRRLSDNESGELKRPIDMTMPERIGVYNHHNDGIQ